jgi:perosamine synthetase
MGKIPVLEPFLSGRELTNLKECLDTNWVSTAGPYVKKFENEVKEYLKAKYTVSTNSGTSSLHIALMVNNVKPEDEVIVPIFSFIATANVVKYLNAHPVFLDCEQNHFNIDTKKLEDFLGKMCKPKNNTIINKMTGRTIKGIIAVHLCGHPANMGKLIEISNKYNLALIEDAAQAMGSKYNNRFAGTLANAGAFSFNGNKIMTTGGGGMLVLSNAKMAEKAFSLINQGKKDSTYNFSTIGFNYRLPSLSAAMGSAQLKFLDKFISVKRKNAKYYFEQLKELDFLYFHFEENRDVFCNKWINIIELDFDKVTIKRENILEYFKKNGIEIHPFWEPIHLQKPYKNSQTYGTSVANRRYKNLFMFPSSVSLNFENIEYIVEILKSIYNPRVF